MAAFTQYTPQTAAHVNTSPYYALQLRKFATYATVTFLASAILFAFLLPFGDVLMISLKNAEQVRQDGGSVLPLAAVTYTYIGEEIPLFNVTIGGVTRQLALAQRGRNASKFIDPASPEKGLIDWEGSWRTLTPVTRLDPHFENFGIAWEKINFPQLFRNTFLIAVIGMFGTLVSSIMVAYAFARFPLPGKNWLFLVLIATIVLPAQVTLVPTYAFFSKIGWTNSWLPLIVPHFFANAYNVFLLRQYFMTLPRALDEAAMIDGAGPLRILRSVIIPQSWPAIISVALFHFVWAWNDYFGPLIYLLGKPELQPIAVGVQIFNFQYGPQPHLVQATSLLAMILPVLLFFFAQRFFMRGVVITGVEK
jgi:multiple sugar transport system permease protein